MQGFFRKIIISARHEPDGGSRARAALEDDFHHFRVEIMARDGRITGTAAEALRFPYSTCPAASDALKGLIGKPISATAHEVYRQIDARLQCTHMLDLAGLSSATLATGATVKEYDIHVSDRTNDAYTVQLTLDSARRLHWQVGGDTILSPPPFAGRSLKAGFAGWALEELDPVMSEAALVARRCAMISIGRQKDLDATRHAAATGHCYSQQSERHRDARRIVGSTLDFSHTHSELCATDRAWMDPAHKN